MSVGEERRSGQMRSQLSGQYCLREKAPFVNDSIAAPCSVGTGLFPEAILLTNEGGTRRCAASFCPRPLSWDSHDLSDGSDMAAILLPIGKASRYPFGKFPDYPAGGRIPTMQTVHDTRRARLSILLDKHKTFAALNEALEWPRTDSRLSRIKNANVRTDREGKVFNMGDAIAREIEKKLNLEEGWMDTPPTYFELHGLEDPRAKVLELMEHMPQSEWATVVRLVDAIAQPPAPANGTTGKPS